MKVKPFLLLFLATSLAHAGLLRPLPLFPGDTTSPDYELLVDGQPVPVAFGEFHGGVSFHYASFEIGEPPSRKTPWTVYHADGYKTTVFLFETKTGWYRLGVYDLNAESWVRLVDPHYQITDGPLVARLVRHSPLGDGGSATLLTQSSSSSCVSLFLFFFLKTEH